MNGPPFHLSRSAIQGLLKHTALVTLYYTLHFLTTHYAHIAAGAAVADGSAITGMREGAHREMSLPFAVLAVSAIR